MARDCTQTGWGGRGGWRGGREGWGGAQSGWRGRCRRGGGVYSIEGDGECERRRITHHHRHQHNQQASESGEETEDSFSDYALGTEAYQSAMAGVHINGRRQLALLDTGSAYDLCSETFWAQCGDRKLERCSCTPTTANSSMLEVVGLGKWRLKVGPCEKEEVVLVARNLGVNVIIGVPALTRLGLSVDFRQGRLSWGKGENEYVELKFRRGRCHTCLLRATRKYRLRAGQGIAVDVATSEVDECKTCLVSDWAPALTTTTRTHPGIVALVNGRTRVWVRNEGTEEEEIEPGAIMAVCEEVKVEGANHPAYEIGQQLNVEQRRWVTELVRECCAMVQLAHNSIPLPVLTSEKSHSLPHLFTREHNPGASTVPQ